uniref:Major sperm protein n=1 Tax=Plectus sambesii TaxID=2011161 RepID=A0A914UI87_9BILA
MASVPPSDIVTQPHAKIVFNAPYDNMRAYQIKVINVGDRRIGYAIKTTNLRRLHIDPPAGVLEPRETALLTVNCEAFDVNSEDTNSDRITIEWTNAPNNAAAGQFRREWFQSDGTVRRKNLPIEYNR